MSIGNNMKLSGLIPFFVLIFTWSFLGGWITLFSRYWIWVTLGSLLVFSLAPSFFKSKQFQFLALYGFVIILNFLLGDAYFNSAITILFEIFQLIFCGGLCYFLIINNADYKLNKRILIIGAFVIVFTSIGTYIADQMFPEIVRTLVVYENIGVSVAPYYRMGVCEYNMPHALPILIAPLIMWLKSKDVKGGIKLLCFLVLAFSLLLVLTSAATTPLILSLFAIVCSLLTNPHKTLKSNLTILVVVALVSLPALNKDVQLGLVHVFKSIIPEDNSNQSKLNDFESAILYGESSGDMAEREDLYSKSFSSFMDNIIIGTNSGDLGGHSIIMDRLGTTGLVGAIPYLLFIWFLLKSVYIRIPQGNRIFFLIGTLCFVATIATKNVGGMWMWIALCVFLPLMLLPQIDQINKR